MALRTEATVTEASYGASSGTRTNPSSCDTIQGSVYFEMCDSLPPLPTNKVYLHSTCILTQTCKPVTSAHTHGPREVIPEFSSSRNVAVLWPLSLTTDQEILDLPFPLSLFILPDFSDKEQRSQSRDSRSAYLTQKYRTTGPDFLGKSCSRTLRSS